MANLINLKHNAIKIFLIGRGKMNRHIVFVSAIALLGLSGCASIVDGSHQVLSVITPNVQKASCTMTNNKGTFYVTTPGTVTVHRSYDPLHVDCTKTGYEDALITVKSSTKGMAFGNILAGGIIGAAVDMGTGAAYDYPQKIVVPMRLAGTPAPAPVASVMPPRAQPTKKMSKVDPPTKGK
jgi:hypothetical protein